MKTRYTFGGDEHLYIEIDDEMSLDAFFKSLWMSNQMRLLNVNGVTEICPANASFQIKFNPDIINHKRILEIVKEIEQQSHKAEKKINTRIIEIPMYYEDPWTHETLMKFRERHQDPSSSDLKYSAKINGYKSVKDFIFAHHSQPWMVTMVGFVAGLPFLYQLVDRKNQLEVPKYLRPRTDTPKLTLGFGGCFSTIYSVRGAGGYQMFGITPMPVYDPRQEISYLKDFMVLSKPGDIVKWKPINREEYDNISREVENGDFNPLMKDFTFNLDDFNKNIKKYNKNILEVLYD